MAAFVLLNEGMRRLGVSRSAAFALMIPVFGAAQSMLILGEHVGPSAVAGGLIVLVGIWLVQGGRLPTLVTRPLGALRPTTQPA